MTLHERFPRCGWILFLDDMYTVAFRVSFAFFEAYVWVNRLLSVGVSI